MTFKVIVNLFNCKQQIYVNIQVVDLIQASPLAIIQVYTVMNSLELVINDSYRNI